MYKPDPVLKKFITSDNVFITFLGFVEAAAVARFAVISNAREGFFKTFFAIFFNILSPFLPRFLKKSPRPSA